MDSKEELKTTKSKDSNPSNSNPKSTKPKEEGELSSSDNDENPVCSLPPPTGTVNLSAATGTILIPPLNKLTQGGQGGKAISSTVSSSFIGIQSRKSVPANVDKSFEKPQVPFNSANPGWYAPLGANDNLVIRFSDDDSGSESEDDRQEKAMEIKHDAAGVDGNRKLPSLSSAKSSKFQQPIRNVNKVIPKKLPLNHTFVSSMVKTNGRANARAAGPSLTEQGARIRNSNTINRNLASQEHGSDQVGLNNTKLQDLRQQIARRERELKLKAAQQNKESIAVPDRDYNAVNIDHDATRNTVLTSADSRQLEPREPDRKRRKVSGSHSTQPNSDVRQDILAARSTSSSKEQVLDKRRMQDRNIVDHSQQGSPITRLESSLVQWQKPDDKRVNNSLENLPSADINSNCSQPVRSSMQVDPCVVLNQTASPTNMNSVILQKNINNTSTGEQNFMNSCEHCEGMSGDKALKPSLDNVCQGSLNNVSHWNYLATVNVSEHSKIDIQSLVEMEESLDKELEEAQEQRLACEIEERNALKAYRKAQRALIEANARCTELYRKRELYSSHIRSFIMNGSSFLLSSGQHEHDIGLKPINSASRDLDPVPTSIYRTQPECDGCNQPGDDSNNRFDNGAPLIMSYQHVSGQNMGSETCSEPDASTSEPLAHHSKNAANGISSPSNDPTMSADEEEETFPLDHDAVPSKVKNQQRGQNHHSNENLSIDGLQDSLILEATLRSELFARLGKRTLSKNSVSSNGEPADELGTENDNVSERTQTSSGSLPSSEAEKNKECDLGGNDKPERSNAEVLVQIQNHENSSLNFHSAADSEVNGCYNGGHELTNSVVLSPPLVFRSVLVHMEVLSPALSFGLQTVENKEDDTYDYYSEKGGCINEEETPCGNVKTKSGEDNVGSFTCNSLVDPFWPLCMYELRGKCNNDECPWQHVRDFSNGNVLQHQHDGSDSAGCQVGSTLHQQKCNGATKLSRGHSALRPPTYLVGLDILKADPHSYESVVARRYGQCWQRCLTICLALSGSLHKNFPADDPFLHGGDGRIEVHGSWNRQLSYFRSRNGIANNLNQTLSNDVQSLEMALLILNQEVNKLDGFTKALSVLSRAIESDRTSETIWIVYLLIFSNIKPVGKDDMFSYAVKNNDRSYGLWLMYINSRMNLDDRVAAYDVALTTLCHQASTSDRIEEHTSACILDLFLQMMDCLCVSGNVEKAIQKIYGFFSLTAELDEPHSPLLSNILACLTVSDKYMFWVCCVYLVMYRKLPDAVVHQFEFEKELLAIKWPPVHLRDDERQRAVKLVEMAVDSARLYINSETLETEANLRAAQHFALSHIRCMAAVDGLECCWNLLHKYMKLYPSCLEFVLISARIWTNDFGGSHFDKFEEALNNWPKEVPGIHCIWNQYIEFALQKGCPDFARELIIRWFNSVSNVQHPPNELADTTDSNSLSGSLESALALSPEFWMPNSNQMDIMFAYLNLCLTRLLQNDDIQAHFAIDRALKAAAPGYFKHGLREHAMFLLTYKSKLKKGAPISEQLTILNAYLHDAQALPVSEPLSRQFINNIEKPRVQQLISNILSPVSSNFSLVNLVLEVWYGPSLLPPKLSQPKELVDFVEAILEMVPSNYQLAFSVCKMLSRGYKSIDVTSDSILYWASSTLVNAVFHAIPIAPEHVWVEAAGILGDIAGIEFISEMFYKRALSVYPFSMKLWNCYYNLSKARGDASTVEDAAREKGIVLG